MAQPALDFFKRRGVIGAIEAVEGTDEGPLPAADGILLLDGRSGTEFDKVERPIDRLVFTSNPFVVANKRCYIEGQFELFAPAAPGTDDAVNDVLLQTAGMASDKTAGTSSVTGVTRYNPVSTGVPSATFYWWHVNKHKKVLGARCNISSLAMTIGERFRGQVRIQGTYEDVSTDALPSITTYDNVPLVSTHDNSTCYVNTDPDGAGVDLLVWAKELSIDFNNALGSKEYTSHKTHAISDRQATWNLRIAATDLADFNPWTLRDAGTVISGRYRMDEGDGLYSELGFRGQIDTIEETDIDGDYGWQLSGSCIASSSATETAGDEFYVEFGDTTPVGSA